MSRPANRTATGPDRAVADRPANRTDAGQDRAAADRPANRPARRPARWPAWARHGLRAAAAIAGLVLLALAARRIDGAALAAALGRLDAARWLLAVAAVLGWKLGAKGLRSQGLLATAAARDGRPAPGFAETARLLLASHAAGQILWSPLGFTVRTIGLARAGWPLASIARVQLGERIAEAVALTAMVALTVAVAGHADLTGSAAIAGAGALLGGRAGLGLLALALIAAAAVAAWAGSAPLRRAARWLGPIGRASLWALLSSAGDLAVLLLAASAVGVPLGLPTALVVFVAVNGATAVPLVPAQVGVMEAAIVVGLSTAGVGAAEGLAVAVAYRAAHVAPLALGGGPGLLALWRATRARPEDQGAAPGCACG
jgi:uncharacterized membrane protein YbhN (UPF0104 family)